MSDLIKINADLHVHGLYSMAVSKQMFPKTIGDQAPLKGLHLVGTGDILNAKWIELVKEQLKPVEDKGEDSLRDQAERCAERQRISQKSKRAKKKTHKGKSKERRKYGLAKARKRYQFSKR